MPNRKTRSALAIVAGTLVLATAFPAAAARSAKRLFWIEKSTNKNIIAYDAQLDDNRLVDSNPVLGYRINSGTNNRPIKLGMLDKLAYGYSVRRDPSVPDSYVLTLKAAKDHPIRVSPWNGEWVAQIAINGKAAVLEKIFVAVDSSGFLPSAKYVEVFGRDMATGQPVTERLQR